MAPAAGDPPGSDPRSVEDAICWVRPWGRRGIRGRRSFRAAALQACWLISPARRVFSAVVALYACLLMAAAGGVLICRRVPLVRRSCALPCRRADFDSAVFPGGGYSRRLGAVSSSGLVFRSAVRASGWVSFGSRLAVRVLGDVPRWMCEYQMLTGLVRRSTPFSLRRGIRARLWGRGSSFLGSLCVRASVASGVSEPGARVLVVSSCRPGVGAVVAACAQVVCCTPFAACCCFPVRLRCPGELRVSMRGHRGSGAGLSGCVSLLERVAGRLDVFCWMRLGPSSDCGLACSSTRVAGGVLASSVVRRHRARPRFALPALGLRHMRASLGVSDFSRSGSVFTPVHVVVRF